MRSAGQSPDITDDACYRLHPDDILELRDLFAAIHSQWGDSTNSLEDMASRWREFIDVKCEGRPSYQHRYEESASLLRQMRHDLGEKCYELVLLDPDVIAEAKSNPETPIAQLRRFVVEEFIRVYAASGGFRTYGGKNYGGFVSGSRYRQSPPYRVSEGT